MSDLVGPVLRKSRVSEAHVDRTAHRFYEHILDWWQWIGVGLLLTALIFGGYWLL
jgi:hypothetical protein